jgi:SPP1 family predicted phage head-tail adaptor
MEPGQLNRRIELQSKRTTRDAIGGEVVTWAFEVATWAEAVPLSGRELMAAQQKHAEISTMFRIRFRPEVTMSSKWRVVCEGVVYDILDILNVGGRNREMQLQCSSGLRSG